MKTFWKATSIISNPDSGMGMNATSISKTFGQGLKVFTAVIVLALVFGSYKAYSQNGTRITDAIFAGAYSSCGGGSYDVSGNNQEYNGISFFNSYGNNAPDVWYTFTVADHASIGFMADAYYEVRGHLLNSNRTEITPDPDSWVGNGVLYHYYSQLPAGTYYIVIEGENTGDNTGDYSLSVWSLDSQTLPEGADMYNAIAVRGVNSCGGSFSDTRSNANICMGVDYQGPNAQQNNDIYYRFYLSAAALVSVSTCGSSIDTYLHLLNGNGEHLMSNDNFQVGCSGYQSYLQTTLNPGLYYVVVQGNGQQTGNIKTTISVPGSGPRSPGADMANAIDFGKFTGSAEVKDSRNSGDDCLADDFGSPANDIYYKFQLASPGKVKIRHTGSSYRSYIWLLNSNGSVAGSSTWEDPPYGWSPLVEKDLQAGTYYIVSERELGVSQPLETNLDVLISDPCVPLAAAFSQNQNHIVTWRPRTPMGNVAQFEYASICKLSASVRYFDGLGRPLQTVQIKGSGDGNKDIVVPNEYDAYSREAKKYLPYASESNNGSYKPDALQPGAGVFSFYNPSGATNPELPGGIPRTPVPYAETRFEASPLNRGIEQGAPGSGWQLGSGHTVRSGYYSNDADNPGTGSRRWVRQFGVSITSNGSQTLVNEGSYGKSQLYVNDQKDENWKESDGRGGTIQEYKDKEGRVVLKRTWKDHDTPLSTYYVYDDFGNLCYVLPPKAEADGGLPATATLNELCYQYRYDEANRMTAKKIPGKDWEYIVYNKLDQVVATQDGQQRQRNEWLINKYDGLGRLVMSGLWQSSISAADLKAQVYNTPQWDLKNASVLPYGYEIRTYPQAVTTVLNVNYYDNYEIPGLPDSYKRTGYSQKTKGLPTATRTAVLNNPSKLLWNVNYYDEEAQVTKNVSQHYKGGTLVEGNYDETDNAYSFTHELLSSMRSHKVNGTEQLRVLTENEYDHMGRQVKTWKTVGGGQRTLLAQNVYNGIGQLQEKRLHSVNQGASFLQKQEYAYNERGWLRRINDPGTLATDRAFAIKLVYNEDNDAAKRQYNGNISSIQWNTRVQPGLGMLQEQQGYEYAYDKLNRLKLAAYTTAGKAGYFNETLSYDNAGNILTLDRTGNNTPIDQLSYVYENGGQSNRLQSVTDASNSDEGQLRGTASYSYDQNGNLRTDSRKGLNFEYNHLNLPKKVTKGSTGESISYLYDAAGRKLRKETAGGNRDYIGGIEYGNDGNIEFIQTEEGRAVNTGGTYSYEYMLKDHLGNTRAVVKQDGSILQTPDYYAFGMELNRNRVTPSPDNRYKYNGKELQTELGLGQYDYGARFYDPVIGRFNVVDRFAEKFHEMTSYQYAANNPIKYIDSNGDSINVYSTRGTDVEGRYRGQSNKVSPLFYKAFQKSLESKDFRDFVGQFATKGLTIAGYTFNSDGEFSDMNFNIQEFNLSPEDQGVIDASQGGNLEGAHTISLNQDGSKVDVTLKIFTEHHSTSSEMAETIGHESQLHGYSDKYLLKAFKESGVAGYNKAKAQYDSGPKGKKDHDALKENNIQHEGVLRYKRFEKERGK